MQLYTIALVLKGYSTFSFLEIGSFYNSLRVKQLSFTIFESIQADFLILRRISVTRQFLVPLTSIVYTEYTIYAELIRKW